MEMTEQFVETILTVIVVFGLIIALFGIIGR